MIPIQGFLPDADPTIEGVIVDCSQFIPFEGGYKGAPSAVDTGLSTLAQECRGAAVVRKLNSNRRFFAGGTRNVYENSGTAWTVVGTASATLSADDLWSFCQFGDVTIAATPNTKIQANTSTTFSEIANAPKAAIVESVSGFVMALRTNETTYGDSPDRWWCSGLYDYTTWTASAATQAQTGRLFGTEGSIVAGRRLGSNMVAYKNRAIYVGTYEGPPIVWSWVEVPGNVGCVGQDAVVNVDIGHVFVGERNIYFFDGVRPIPLADGQVRDWFIDRLSPQYKYKTKLLFDRLNQRVWIFFPSLSSTGDCDSGLVYHLVTKKWGVAAQNVAAAINFVSSGITYDSGSPLITTYDGTTLALSYDSPFWLASGETPAFIGTDEKTYTLSGVTQSSSFTTGDVGKDGQYLRCNKVRVRYTSAPDTSSMTGFVKDTEGGDLTQKNTSSLADGKYDARQNGRFHRFKFDNTGDYEVTGYEPSIVPGGTR